MYTTLISAEEVAQHLKETHWRLVDCRFALMNPEQGAEDYQVSHVPGAVYAHMNADLSAPVVPGQTGRHPLPEIEHLVHLFSHWGIDRSVQVVAYDDFHGGMAARLWWLLRWLGHEQVAVLDGGWRQWKALNLPINDEVTYPEPRVFIPEIQSHLIIDTAFISQNLPMASWCLVDSRERERYLGLHEPIDPVAGHIPGAKNYPYLDNLDGNTWKSAAEFRRRFAPLHDHYTADQTAFYCGSGVTACHNVLAYTHAGYGFPKLYPGSWSEWITDQGRPVNTSSEG